MLAGGLDRGGREVMAESWLQRFGWEYYAASLEHPPEPEEVGRIIGMQRGHCQLASSTGCLDGVIAGRLKHRAKPTEMPAVGDWVRIAQHFQNDRGEPGAMIREVLPRRSQLARLQAGRIAEQQVIAANIDRAFVVTSANAELKERRLQRYLMLAREGGIEPVIVLSKIDLTDPAPALNKLETAFPDVRVIAVSGLKGLQLELLRGLLDAGSTGIVVGSSGVGKSTLVNALLGEQVQEISDIRKKDARGRHTTTSREMFVMPGDALLIDTPGLRELQIFGEEESLVAPFARIEALAEHCAFRDCRHRQEPGCAVLAAVEDGSLNRRTHADYLKLQGESAAAKEQMTRRQRTVRKRRGKLFRGRRESESASGEMEEES